MSDQRFAIFRRFSPEARQAVLSLFVGKRPGSYGLLIDNLNVPMKVGAMTELKVCPIGCALVTDHKVTPTVMIQSGGSPDCDVTARRLLGLRAREVESREAGRVSDPEYWAIKEEASNFYDDWDRSRITSTDMVRELTAMGLASKEQSDE